MSDDYIKEKYDARAERVQERLEAIGPEITNAAVQELDAAGSSARVTVGPLLNKLVLERLCLIEMINAREAAIERARDEQRQREEYDERVLRPHREIEAKEQARRHREEERDALVRGALGRVKATINRVERPDAADVALLRQNTSYQDRYVAHGDIDRLLMRIDRAPWWPTKSETTR